MSSQDSRTRLARALRAVAFAAVTPILFAVMGSHDGVSPTYVAVMAALLTLVGIVVYFYPAPEDEGPALARWIAIVSAALVGGVLLVTAAAIFQVLTAR